MERTLGTHPSAEQAMGIRAAGSVLVLEGRIWECQVPRSAVGAPFGTAVIAGRALPIGCLELLVKMQLRWSYHDQDTEVIQHLYQYCDQEVLKQIHCKQKPRDRLTKCEVTRPPSRHAPMFCVVHHHQADQSRAVAWEDLPDGSWQEAVWEEESWAETA